MNIVEKASKIANLMVPDNLGLLLSIDGSGYPTATSPLDSILNAPPVTPSIQTPSNGSSSVSITPTITASAFSLQFPNGDTFTGSNWQIATDVNFTNIVQNITLGGTTTCTLGIPLAYVTTYYARVRYEDSGNIWSNWSTPISFITMAVPHGSQSFDASGTFIVPAGLYSLTVLGVGAGSGGTGGGGDAGDGGIGGNAGAGYNQTVNVTPGQVLTITIGTGGAGGIGAPAGSGSDAPQATGLAGGATIISELGISIAGGPAIAGNSANNGTTADPGANSYYTSVFGVTTGGAGNPLGNGYPGNHGGGGGGGGAPHTGYYVNSTDFIGNPIVVAAYGNGGNGGNGYVRLSW